MGNFWEHRQNLWTSREVNLLRQLIAERQSSSDIAERLGRSPDSVRDKIHYLGLRRAPPSPWNPSTEAMLRQGWSEGLSFSQIAKQIGSGLTRNGCIGKAHRLGLPVRQPEKAPKTRVRPERKTKFQPKETMAAAPRTPQMPVDAFKPPAAADIPPSLNKTILGLTWGDCRWPVNNGQPEYLFCGHPRVNGSSYCAAHYRIGHNRRNDYLLAKGPGPQGMPNWNVPR